MVTSTAPRCVSPDLDIGTSPRAHRRRRPLIIATEATKSLRGG